MSLNMVSDSTSSANAGHTWLAIKEVRVAVVSADVVPSQRSAKLVAIFKVRRTPKMAPIAIPSATFVPMRVDAQLWFKLAVDQELMGSIRLACMTREWDLRPNGEIVFENPVELNDIEFISSLRSGRDVYVGWKLDAAGVFQGQQGVAVLASICEKAVYPEDYLQLSPQQFKERIAVPAGLSNRVLIEVPVSGVNEDLAKKVPPDLNELLKALELANTDLEQAHIGLEGARTSSDYDGVISKVRSTADRLRGLIQSPQAKSDMARYLYVETSKAKGVGGQGAAEDVIGGLENVLKGLFEICSKSPHGKTKQGQAFAMSFDAHDAKALIGLCIGTVGYIQRRLEQYVLSCK